MAFLDDIGAQLATASVASSSGSSSGAVTYQLIKNWLPDSTGLQDRVVALIETAGMSPTPRGELDTPGLQVMIRGGSLIKVSSAFSDARSTAESIKTTLHALGPFSSTSGRYYPGIRAMQDPFLLHVDELKRPVYAINFLAWRSRT